MSEFNLNSLNEGQLKALAVKLMPYRPEPAVDKPEPMDDGELDVGTEIQDGKLIYLDPSVKDADEAVGRAMKALPTGVATYVGKGGTTIVNHSAETIETIGTWKKNRKLWRTRSRV